MSSLELTGDVVDAIEAHGEETYPYECCGFMFGTDGQTRVIDEVQRVDNAKEGDQRRRFQIDPKDYQEAERAADSKGKQLLGVYHSHPDHPAEPSEHDRKQAMPFFSYIIVSVQDGEAADLRSWQLNPDRAFDEEKVLTETTKTEK